MLSHLKLCRGISKKLPFDFYVFQIVIEYVAYRFLISVVALYSRILDNQDKIVKNASLSQV